MLPELGSGLVTRPTPAPIDGEAAGVNPPCFHDSVGQMRRWMLVRPAEGPRARRRTPIRLPPPDFLRFAMCPGGHRALIRQSPTSPLPSNGSGGGRRSRPEFRERRRKRQRSAHRALLRNCANADACPVWNLPRRRRCPPGWPLDARPRHRSRFVFDGAPGTHPRPLPSPTMIRPALTRSVEPLHPRAYLPPAGKFTHAFNEVPGHQFPPNLVPPPPWMALTAEPSLRPQTGERIRPGPQEASSAHGLLPQKKTASFHAASFAGFHVPHPGRGGPPRTARSTRRRPPGEKPSELTGSRWAREGRKRLPGGDPVPREGRRAPMFNFARCGPSGEKQTSPAEPMSSRF